MSTLIVGLEIQAPEGLLTATAYIFVAFFSALVLFALWIWRHASNLDDDHVIELEDSHLDDFLEIFTDILLEAMERFDKIETNDPEREEVKMAIKDNIQENQLNSMIEALHRVGSGRELYEECINSYESAYKYIAISALGVISIPILAISVSAAGGPPFSYPWDAAHGIIGIFSAIVLYLGLDQFFQGRNRQRELDGIARNV